VHEARVKDDRLRVGLRVHPAPCAARRCEGPAPPSAGPVMCGGETPAVADVRCLATSGLAGPNRKECGGRAASPGSRVRLVRSRGRPSGGPAHRQRFGHLWRPAAQAAKLTEATGTGMHALWHYYASLHIRYGESVKTVQGRLGHKSATKTLDAYGHMWADSDDRSQEAVDSVLGARADSLRTGGHA
jgi:hypothetical protein